MKAVICTKYGPPEVLKQVRLKKPTPKKNEVLIKIKATSVTMADHRLRSFDIPKGLALPVRLAVGWNKPKYAVLGMEMSGIIEAIGSNVTKFNIGDHIFGSTSKDLGGYAAYKCLPEDGPLAIKPRNTSFEEAATIPVGARTALQYVQGNIIKGQKILIYGASGSVGTYAIQLANYYGAEVSAVCSEANFALVKSLGAYHVYDYASPGFPNNLETYDMILLAVPKWPFSKSIKFLNDGGIYADITNPIQSLAMLWTRMTTTKNIIMGKNPGETGKVLKALKELVETGHLKPVIDRVYSLDQIVEAHRYVDIGHKKGNVAITVCP